MNALAKQQCRELAEVEKLDTAAISENLKQLANWRLDEEQGSLHAEFRFNNYCETMAFINVVAQIAHRQDHHPDIRFGYNHCRIDWRTHSVDGLSLKDFICAAKIDAALQWL